MSLPRDFAWGVATSSYQIEGSVGGGRGECIWHRFSHTPGKVKNGENGDVACDHLHRYREDVALMRDLNIRHYRFSTSWPRVLPNGTGTVNPHGLDFYDSLVDSLLEAGITPYVTLYHWDLPQVLQDKGGWENPDSVGWFTDYARLMTERLGDRVTYWITHNEPWCAAFLSNHLGVHAPGKRDLSAAITVAHHLLRSHGMAARAIRDASPSAKVGIAINMNGITPVSDDPRDIKAARNQDGYFNRWFLDPVFLGQYPADIVEQYGPAMDRIQPDAVEVAAVPLDFLGLNYYQREYFGWDDDAPPLHIRNVRGQPAEKTAMDWEVHPQSLTDILIRLNTDYKVPPIYITENGAAYDDPEPVNGVVEDPQRVSYYSRHFDAVAAAYDAGVPVAGYFAWSLMDNFEWAEGYDKRFGIVHVDFKTLKRTPKRSALAYRDFIAAQTT